MNFGSNLESFFFLFLSFPLTLQFRNLLILYSLRLLFEFLRIHDTYIINLDDHYTSYDFCSKFRFFFDLGNSQSDGYLSSTCTVESLSAIQNATCFNSIHLMSYYPCYRYSWNVNLLVKQLPNMDSKIPQKGTIESHFADSFASASDALKTHPVGSLLDLCQVITYCES